MVPRYQIYHEKMVLALGSGYLTIDENSPTPSLLSWVFLFNIKNWVKNSPNSHQNFDAKHEP